MLQIRLNKAPSADVGGREARSDTPDERVTVACPEHLVIANLPVAKSVGKVAAAAFSFGRNIGRRSRRQLGEKIHFCVICDFPIAIYGRLIPCEHAFCLTCARNDPGCYLCDERVQKIQSIKKLEAIFICAAPHCLKSFVNRAEFELHLYETHADLLQPNTEMEVGNEANNLHVMRPSSADQQQQFILPEACTARASQRSGFSPGSEPQPQENRPWCLPSRDQPILRAPPRLRRPPFPSCQPHQPGSSPPQVSDRPNNWLSEPQDNQDSTQYPQDSDQVHSDRRAVAPPESLFPNYAAHLPQQPNYSNQTLITATKYSDGLQPYNGAARYESVPKECGSEQRSVLDIPPAPWGMALVGMNFLNMPAGQDPEGTLTSPADSQGGISFFKGDYGQGLPRNLLPVNESEQQGGDGNHSEVNFLLPSSHGLMQISQPLPPPPPPPPPLPTGPPPLSQRLNRFSTQGVAE